MRKVILVLLIVCSAVALACVPNTNNEPKLVLLRSEVEAKSTGGNYSVVVASTMPWSVSTNKEWIILPASEGNAGGLQYFFTVTANTEAELRTAEITFASKTDDLTATLTVKQSAFTPEMTLTSNMVEFSWSGGSKIVDVIANFDYEIASNAEWLTVSKSTLGGVLLVATPNEGDKERKAVVTLSNEQYSLSRTVEVTQNVNVLRKSNGWAEMPSMPANENYEYGTHDKLPSNNKLRNYSFCFDKEKHCALWVAYPLHECYTKGSGHRTDDWEYDPCCIDDQYEPNLKNAYYPQGGSSYSHSRGHQLPSADRLASDEDNATTFYFTNMTPQLQSLNGASWEKLENDIRNKWMCSDTIYVVTGAHFADGYGYAYDNKGAGKPCAVPTHYYKVILRTKKGNSGKWVGNCSADELQCVGFWFEHKGGAARQTMSVADIEDKTGHTFFPNVKNAPKSTYNSSDWQ